LYPRPIIGAVVFIFVGMSNVVSFLLRASMLPIAVAGWINRFPTSRWYVC
jgi:hypothetical protein